VNLDGGSDDEGIAIPAIRKLLVCHTDAYSCRLNAYAWCFFLDPGTEVSREAKDQRLERIDEVKRDLEG
jgi:hypothetical protein